MSSFTPLNIVFEDESEDEVDDSKEIQIEEALKLYQNALKLHSQGSEFYDEAENAYKELFKSEIFTYTESLSESQWIDLHGEFEYDEDGDEDDSLPDNVANATSTDGAPSTLPQILYLAYKNHGQFLLDRMRHQLVGIECELISTPSTKAFKEASNIASSGLKDLVEALDRDESDLEVWRNVSRVFEFLGSKRAARFCLEAVLDGDGKGALYPSDSLDLEESFAVEQLKPLLLSIEGPVSNSQLKLLPGNSRSIISALRTYIDPCPYLRKISLNPTSQVLDHNARKQEINIPNRTWASCGQAILLRLDQEARGAIITKPGASYILNLPPRPVQAPSARMCMAHEVDRPSPNDRKPPEVRETGSQHRHPLFNTVGGTATSGPVAEVLASPVDIGSRGMDSAEASPTKIAVNGTDDKEMQAEVLGEHHDIQQEGSKIPAIVSLPTRKRSSEAAELPDSTDVGRARSKRIKARGSFMDPASLNDTTAEEWSRWYEQQLQIYVRADELAFKATEDLLSKFGCKSNGSLEELRENVLTHHSHSGTEQEGAPRSETSLAIRDLKDILDSGEFARSKAFLHGDGQKDYARGTRGIKNPGIIAILEQSYQGTQKTSQSQILPDDFELERFANYVNQQTRISLNQLVFQWIHELLKQQNLEETDSKRTSMYEAFTWPEVLKQTVVQVLVNHDALIFSEATRQLNLLERLPGRSLSLNMPRGTRKGNLDDCDNLRRELTGYVQAILELHIDVYSIVTNPFSEVDAATRILQRDRLARWAAFSSRLVNELSWPGFGIGDWDEDSTHLALRFMWASVLCSHLLDPSFGDHTVWCFQDLIRVLGRKETKEKIDRVAIHLPNNVGMPEISIDVAEKEVSRITTMDFFSRIFDTDDDDPLTIIEALEPLLDLSIRHKASWNSNGDANGKAALDPKFLETWQFLERGSLSLKLFMWQTLRDAYSVVNYPPQILSCNLRSFTLIVDHLSHSSYTDGSKDARHHNLLQWLHRLDDLMSQIMALTLSNATAFDCIDDEHVRSSMESFATLQRILHVFALWEDSIRVGKTQAPTQVNNTGMKAQAKSADKFRDMLVKAWTLQYVLMKEGMSQNDELFTTPAEDLINYLKLAHHALGLRTYCSLANKIFLKLMKAELLRLKSVPGWEVDMSQVIFDLYGLKISSIPADMQDHACETTEIDRHTALEILDLVLLHINRLNIKDLLKSDLKFTVDKMSQIIKAPKSLALTVARTFNKRLVNNHLKLPVNPMDLYRSFRGLGSLCSSPTHSEDSMTAQKGWYFLLGHVALAKFRSQKRITAGSTDDLENAKTFLKMDLEFNTERWETWYRLAQVFDTIIEEYTTWTAEKLENNMSELIELQRKAILCYTMAVAVATRCADASFEDASKIADLYADFGTRVYASSREPFSMKAFSLEGFTKHFSGQTVGMYEGHPFKPMNLYSAWKFASSLLRKASIRKPKNWVTFYTLGKCLSKMHNCGVDVRGPVKQIDHQLVINAFVRAIELVPEKRDSRHPEKDPILEPHYKLVSVVHKLVQSKRLSAEEACRTLQATSYSRKVPNVQDPEDWEGYILQVLKALRSADKSNWHHRMVARAAHIIYDDDPSDSRAALGAKHELTQQIFTKTMTIQVWKPDNERAGRHFVYTNRYVMFCVRLLYQLNDKDNFELLARRIRKKTGDFVYHTELWLHMCNEYTKLLRNRLPVPLKYDEHIFKSSNPEAFFVNSARLETWVQSPATQCAHLEILRDAIEFKKLNSNLDKSTNIEDLIADIYAHIYDYNVPDLIAKEAEEEDRSRMRLGNILAAEPSTVATLPTGGPNDGGGDQTTSTRPRAKHITRREIIRKAEALVTKAPAVAPAKTPRAIAPAPETGKTPNLAVVIHQDAGRDTLSSAPASVHDDADDESELSDAQDAVNVRQQEDHQKQENGSKALGSSLFPNLKSVNHGEVAWTEAEDDHGEMGSPADGEDNEEEHAGDDEDGEDHNGEDDEDTVTEPEADIEGNPQDEENKGPKQEPGQEDPMDVTADAEEGQKGNHRAEYIDELGANGAIEDNQMDGQGLVEGDIGHSNDDDEAQENDAMDM